MMFKYFSYTPYDALLNVNIEDYDKTGLEIGRKLSSLINANQLDKRIALSLLIFIALTMLQYPTMLVPNGVPVLTMLCYLVFIVYIALYALASTSTSKQGKARYERLFGYAFYAFCMLGLICLAGTYLTINTFFAFFENLIKPIGFSLMFIPAIFFVALGSYLLYTTKEKRLGAAMLMIAFIIIALYLNSKFLVKSYAANDEEILMLYSVKATLAGLNPYTQSVSQTLSLLDIANKSGFTMTTSSGANGIVGTMDYPALFFLSFMPFYFLAPPVFASLGTPDLTVEATFYIFALLVSIWYVLDRDDLLKPRGILLFFIIITLPSALSTATYLMLAAIVLAYAKLDSKYAWVFMGIAVSLQEELWFPVVLMLLYSFNNKGLGKGMRDAIGTIGTFLLFNGYFIILNPFAYFNAVFLTLSAYIFPNPLAPFGFYIFANYNLPLSFYFYIFVLVAAALALAFLYLNDKKLIPLFTILAFMFLSHAEVSYYYFFALAFVVAMYMKKDKLQKGAFRQLAQRYRNVKYGAMAGFALLILALIAVVYEGHMMYINQANFSISDVQAYIVGNTLHYNATLTYNPTYANGNVLYLAIPGYHYSNYLGIYGVLNNSLMNGTTQCEFPCSININRLSLNSSGKYRIIATAANFSGNIYASALVYNGKYAYQSSMSKASPT